MKKETFRVLGRPEVLIEQVTQQDFTQEEVRYRNNAYGAAIYLQNSRNRIANHLEDARADFRDVIPGVIFNAIAKSSLVKKEDTNTASLEEESLAYGQNEILKDMVYVRIYFEVLDNNDHVYFRPETSSFFVNINDFYEELNKAHFIIQAPPEITQGFVRGDFSPLIKASVISGGLDLTLKGQSLVKSNTRK